MARKQYTAEKNIGKLREGEVAVAQRQKLGVMARMLGVSDQTYCRWRREYGGPRVEQAKQLRDLERENRRLKRLVAGQALDNAMLRDLAEGNF